MMPYSERRKLNVPRMYEIASYADKIKLSRRRKESTSLRRIDEDGIDPTVIHMEITDDMNQTIEELALRISLVCDYFVDDVIEYLLQRKLYTIERFQDNTLRYIPWTPGLNCPMYTAYRKALKYK